MRYELTDYEWSVIKPMLPNKPRGIPRVDDRRLRVHQHGSCIAGNKAQHMGRSRGGLTSKIHAVVDANGLPIRVGLTPGEPHDNRLCSVLLTGLRPRTMLLAD